MTPPAVLTVINAQGGGMTDATLERALAIVYAESGLNKDAVNSIGATGLFQILVPVHIKEHPDWTTAAMKIPEKNVVAARTLSDGWKNWQPWTTFTSGAYLLFIPQAKSDIVAWHKATPASGSAAIDAVVGTGEAAAGAVDAAAQGWDAVTGFLGALSNPHTWLRVADTVVGSGLVLTGLNGLTGGHVGSAARHVPGVGGFVPAGTGVPAGISGTGVAAACAGGVLIYAGLTDANPVAALKAVLAGHPAPVPNIPGTVAFPDAAANNAVAGSVDGTYGGRIVADARKYLGRPYRWGAAGPDAFDCSGLVTYVLHHDLGLSLPSNAHTTTTGFLSWSGATTLPSSQIQPGDLIVSVGHIAIASGGGRMIEAPGAGKNVREVSQRIVGCTIRRVKNQTGSFSDVPNSRKAGVAF
jgi:cell wall-associated NlpC family hydrolase